MLGHEIAHNVAHHAAERMSSGAVMSVALVFLSLFLGLPDFGSRILLELGFERPGSRKQESEADYIGLSMHPQGTDARSAKLTELSDDGPELLRPR